MQAIILAAGESSRFWPLNQKHKSLLKIMGRSLIWHTIEGLKKSGIKEIIIVQGQEKDIEEELKKYIECNDVKYVVQPEPKGTGDAVWQTKDLIKNDFVVVGGHKVDIAEYLPSLIKKGGGKVVLTGVKTNMPWDHGVFRFEGDKIAEIIENPEKGKEPSNINAAETYLLPKDFFEYYKKTGSKEDSLIDAINLLIKDRGAEFILLEKNTISLKYPWRLFEASDYLLGILQKKISGKVENHCSILGQVIVGEGTLVRSGVYIEGPVYIGKNCDIGPNCFVRPFSNIGDNCHIGNGVEIKNSIVGDESKVPHLSYVGDSIIGENCNLGAGTITANLRFDKKTIKTKVKGNLLNTDREKFGCVMGDNTQTGINVSLMPGVLIGSDCVVGPGSIVSENLENNTNFYTKIENVRKSG